MKDRNRNIEQSINMRILKIIKIDELQLKQTMNTIIKQLILNNTKSLVKRIACVEWLKSVNIDSDECK